MKIKTYPLQFSEEDLNEIAEFAKEGNPKGTIKEFIYEAIKEKKESILAAKVMKSELEDFMKPE